MTEATKEAPAEIKPQRLIKMEVHNFLRITFLELEFGENENLVIISGNNGEGKSSALYAIEAVLGGGKHVPAEPLHKGKAKGYIVLETTDFIVKRTFTVKSTQLTLEAKDGGKIKEPMAVLRKLIGSISFDPLAFSNMKPTEQVVALQKLLGLDFTKLDTQLEDATENRKEVKRDLKAAEARLDTAQSYSGMPKDLVSSIPIIQKIEEAQKQNEKSVQAESDMNTAAIRHDSFVSKFNDANERLTILQTEVKQLESERNKAFESIGVARKNYSDLLANAVDTEPFKKELAELESTNEKIRSNKLRSEIRKDVDDHQRKVNDAEESVLNLRQDKQDQLSAAKMPVAGLSFDETGVRYSKDGARDIPFEQCSQAEKLRISTAMAVAENPKLPVMLIKDGSLLDDKSLKLMNDLATEHKVQIILEYAGNHKDAKIVMEDGEAAEVINEKSGVSV